MMILIMLVIMIISPLPILLITMHNNIIMSIMKTNLVSITMVDDLCSQTILQKSASVSGSGPFERSIVNLNPFGDDFFTITIAIIIITTVMISSSSSSKPGITLILYRRDLFSPCNFPFSNRIYSRKKGLNLPIYETGPYLLSEHCLISFQRDCISSCISPVFAPSVGRIYRSQGPG